MSHHSPDPTTLKKTYQPNPAILELGEGFYDEVKPANFPKLQLRFRNQEWAERIGLGDITEPDWQSYFAEFAPLPANLQKPLALRYHGHQFQHYNSDLGDGRGFLYAQLNEPKTGRLLDLGTKGSGQTPYSRRGDGRLTLKGAVREVLATEMLESLGVNTSKTFSVFETGEALERHDEPSPTRGAVLVRLNHSHVRFGTFQRFAFERDPVRLQKLVNYCLLHFDSGEHVSSDPLQRASVLLKQVSLRAADLAASWMAAGFVHGVLNTDNMNITGESFDYGPYRFLPKYDPDFTAAYFDSTGLYAYGRQPEIVLWNLEQLASSLAASVDPRRHPEALIHETLATSLHVYAPRFNEAIVEKFINRLGLKSAGLDQDEQLIMSVLQFLSDSAMTFPQFFHDWYGGMKSEERALRSPEAQVYKGDSFQVMRSKLNTFTPKDETLERLTHPYFNQARPCSMLIEEIEYIWEAIATEDDWTRFEEKIEDIRVMGLVYGTR